MTGVELLRALAEAASGTIGDDRMPNHAVRFALEYEAVPDLAAERQKLAVVLGTSNFSLTPLDAGSTGASARHLVLQFPGVERTLSRRALYEIAEVLRERIALVACEPDAGAIVFTAPEAPGPLRDAPESVITDLWCWSKAPVPIDHLWAPKSVRAPEAWQLSAGKGAGILIGQPDTGVAAHPELGQDALALDKAFNIIDGGRNPTDPLAASMSNPGHGTATASVAVSREAGSMSGSAPGARLVPIRCINDVKIFDGAPVAAAVVHARKVGCDVVTMSLGGIWSGPLAAAISDAVDAGMIVLAAAGNCVGFVVYPASDDNVIAVAGVDVNDAPWKGTSSGHAVTISAPAENVFVARREPGDGGAAKVTGAQGTSFAVAMTAGVAALWLAHHGKAAVKAEAARRHTTVQELFRQALRQKARVPTGWDRNRYGAGIVDAGALLGLKLSDIDAIKTATVETSGTLETVARLAAARRTVDGFDWRRHGAEASLLAAEAAIISRRASAGIETLGTRHLRPSSALERSAPAILRNLLGSPPTTTLAPVVTRPQVYNESLLKIVGKSQGGGTESTASVTAEAAQRRLQSSHSKVLLDKLDKAFRDLPAADGSIAAERRRLLADAENGLKRLATDGVDARLTGQEIVGLEGLVRLHDRPALRVRDGRIDRADPLIGDWAGPLLPVDTLLRPALQSVGRVDLGGRHVGTGFVVAPGRIMTNRHVLEAIAEEFRTTGGASRWEFIGEASINFADDGRGNDKRFRIRSLVATGPDRIDEIVDFNHLDVAILEVETTNAAGTPLPAQLAFAGDASLASERGTILVAGYPAQPGVNALRDPDTGQFRDDVIARLGKIFGLAYSVKYLSPGEIDKPVGTLGGDARTWAFAHDATTLGGNSGSWVFNFGDPFAIVGLHFGGGTLRANFAHGMAAVRSAAALPAAAFEGWKFL